MAAPAAQQFPPFNARPVLRAPTPPEENHLRQVVSFYLDATVPQATKNALGTNRLFKVRFLLRAADDAGHVFPQSWHALGGANGFGTAVAQLDAIFTATVPPWIPSEVLNLAGPSYLRCPTLPVRVLETNQAWTSPTAAGNHATLNNSRIWTDISNTIDPNKTYKSIVQAAADLAFSLAASPRGRGNLAAVLKGCIDGWNRTGDQHHFVPRPNMDLMQSYLAEAAAFMSDLARTFPEIRIENSRALGGCAAQTDRHIWQAPFDANASCTISVNQKVVTAAWNAGRIATNPSTSFTDRERAIDSWANSLLELSIAIAHEFVHVLTGRMIGGGPGRPNTPILVHNDIDEISEYAGAVLTQAEQSWVIDPNRVIAQMPQGLRTKMYGEAGFAWEGLVFGGRLMFFSDAALRLNGASRDMSAGVPWFV